MLDIRKVAYGYIIASDKINVKPSDTTWFTIRFTIEELQPQFDALKEDNNALTADIMNLTKENNSLTEKNQLLNDENARLRKALADAGVAAD